MPHQVNRRLAVLGDDLEQFQSTALGMEEVEQVRPLALLDAAQGLLLEAVKAVGGHEESTQGMVGAFVVVELDPAVDLAPRIGEVDELDLAQEFFLEAGVERLDLAVDLGLG